MNYQRTIFWLNIIFMLLTLSKILSGSTRTQDGGERQYGAPLGCGPSVSEFEPHSSHICSVGQVVKASPFHGGITSSILVRSINSHLEYDYK